MKARLEEKKHSGHTYILSKNGSCTLVGLFLFLFVFSLMQRNIMVRCCVVALFVQLSKLQLFDKLNGRDLLLDAQHESLRLVTFDREQSNNVLLALGRHFLDDPA